MNSQSEHQGFPRETHRADLLYFEHQDDALFRQVQYFVYWDKTKIGAGLKPVPTVSILYQRGNLSDSTCFFPFKNKGLEG